ncbi:MAG: CPBP family intramembrane metalloprotease [Anaerolineae bacterium]|nr:CPBP family intramembrane metalloprotease [Anaerolineae bacterium]
MTSNKNKTIRNIIIFTLLVTGLAWLGPVLGGDPTEPGLGFLVWGTAPAVSALIVKFVLRDKTSLGFRPHFRGNGRYYLLSLLLYPVSILIVLSLGLLLGASSLGVITLPALFTTMAPLAVTFFIFALFEETGWRGYLAPSVYSLNDRLLGHAVVGIIWASWHFPYLHELLAHTAEGLLTVLPRFLLGAMVTAVVYGEIRIRTGSVWPAVLMHWTGNTLANTLLATFAGAGFVTLLPEKAWLGSFGMEGVLMILIFGLVGGYLYMKRRRQNRQQAPELEG